MIRAVRVLPPLILAAALLTGCGTEKAVQVRTRSGWVTPSASASAERTTNWSAVSASAPKQAFVWRWRAW